MLGRTYCSIGLKSGNILENIWYREDFKTSLENKEEFISARKDEDTSKLYIRISEIEFIDIIRKI